MVKMNFQISVWLKKVLLHILGTNKLENLKKVLLHILGTNKLEKTN